MSEVKHIPLESFHQKHGARFVPFAGWSMPVQYTSIIQEHQSIRERVGLFDVSHMGEVILSGNQCEDFLNYLLTNDYSNLEIGRSKYSMMCYADGGVVDDLIVYRLAEQEYLICVNAGNASKDYDWIVKQSAEFDVQLEDQSLDYSLLAIQGPESVVFMETLTSDPVADLKRFQHISTEIAGVRLIVSRTGYTGEDGFEIYIPAKDSLVVAETIEKRAEELELKDFYCGLGCRDSLRLEAGYPLYGHEIDDVIDPITAGLGWTVKFNKESDFIGKSALQKLKEKGTDQRVKFFRLNDRRIARQGEVVWDGEEEVGHVLSGTFSPGISLAIGSMLVKVDRVDSESLEVRLRGKPFSISIVKPPIHLSL